MKHIGQHAIVIGAGTGGLLAARALSDFYAVVTVLERDTFPLSDIPRKGASFAAVRPIATACLRWRSPAAYRTGAIPPTRLLHPSVVMRVIRGNLGCRSNSSGAAPAGARA